MKDTELHASRVLHHRDKIERTSPTKTEHNKEWTYLLQKEATFLSQRSPTLSGFKVTAADEGRKKATLLPPLGMEREPTFHRHPRGFVTLQHPDEAGESHWQRKYKKVSMAVDRQVVKHLKKKLNKRLEEKLHEPDSDSDQGDNNNKGMTKQKFEKSKLFDGNIFSKYSDLGEKLTPSSTPTPRKMHPNGYDESRDQLNGLDESGSFNSHQKGRYYLRIPESFSGVKNGVNGHSQDHTNHSKLPDINGSKQPEVNVVKEMNGTGNSDSTDGNPAKEKDAQKVSESEDENDLLELTKLGKIVEDEPEIESFRDIDVSPVQTPVMCRPITREQTRVTFSDKMTEILRGDIHRSCPAQNRTLSIYVCAGFEETIAERTTLIEKVYPEIRTFCSEQGYELEIYDLHWGIEDPSVDDHSYFDTCRRELEKCLSTSKGINILGVMGEKYGSYLLPSTIPVEEFQEIYDHAMDYRRKEVQQIKNRIAEIEQKNKERQERQNQHIVLEPSDVPSEASKTADDENDSRKGSSHRFRTNADIVKREQQVIKALKEKQDGLASPTLLQQWYKLDENIIPPVYRLQNISTYIKEFTRGDARRREAARHVWYETAEKLRRLLDEFADFVIKDPSSRKNYFTSILHRELEQGVLETDCSENHALIIQRIIPNIRAHLHDVSVKNFIDMHPTRENRLAPQQTEFMETLINDGLPGKMDQGHILTYEVDWSTGGIQQHGHRPHQLYLERMCRQVCDCMKRELKKSFDDYSNTQDSKTKLFEEVSQHVSFCQERARSFQGRKELLQLMKSYLRSNCHMPLVLYGKAGCGKTAIACKVAKEVHKWFKGQSPSVVVRIVGRTTGSSNVRSLLQHLCLQLCHVYDNNRDDVPTEFKGLINDFAQRMNQATREKPLFIFLDSLDQLTDEHNARSLSWLPKKLPEHVKLILTTKPDEKYECLDSLKKIFGAESDTFVEVPELPQDDAIAVLEHWLRKSNRTLTHEQFDLLVESFKKCPYPLYLKLAFNESLNWPSYADIEHTKLSDTITKMAALKYGKLETKHGEALVRRAMGYITASREGVTSNEMEDLLSIDEAVMDEVTMHYRPPKRRLPSVLWVRLKADLASFLTETLTHGIVTLRWTHSQFIDAAVDRYLKNRDKAPSYHKAMAEYFMGVWAEKPKPYVGHDKGVFRYISAQPLYFQPSDSMQDGTDRVYNVRRVNELPHHLLNSQQMNLYKSQSLCNFEWVHAKLCGTSLRSLVEEYEIGLSVEPGDVELKTLSDTIQLSAKALAKDPRQLATQMIGRLHDILANDVPKAPGDPPKYPYLQSFMRQAQAPSLPALVPSVGCLTEPGGILFDLLSGHSEPITAVSLTTDGYKALTASKDNTMKLWDLRTGKVMKTLNDVGTNISIIRAGYNNAYVVTVESNIIRIWNLRYSECVLTVDQYPDPPVIGMAAEGKYLVAIFDGNNMMRTWNLAKSNVPLVCEAKTEDHRVYKDHSALIAPFSYEDKMLHASRGANLALVQHVRSGKLLHTLKCNDGSSAVTSLGITRDYYILACRQHYMQLHEIYQLELFDLKKGRYLRSVRGCIHDQIKELYTNYIGSHAIAICGSEETSTSDIAIWNIETEDHKHLARHASVSTMGACSDFRYCLTAGKNDKTLRIWNLAGKINQSMPRLKKQLGVSQILTMRNNPRYVVARQLNNGPVSVWNVARARCLKNAVRIERSLSDSSDVVVVRDTKVVILTGKGISNAAENARPVFQDVHIYDLLRKKFVKRLEKCYIVPCPAHEYVILDDEHLLGLSESRTHFVIWSLTNGHALHRIKPNLKDLEKKIACRDAKELVNKRGHTAKMTPWERRVESHSARRRRREAELEQEKKKLDDLKKEKDNGMDKYLLSGDQKIAVASFFAHFMCVFDIENHTHLTTLESDNSMLFLLVADLTYNGNYLVQANYDDEQKMSYVTLWNCFEGTVKKRLKNETNVMALGISDDASRIVIGKGSKELHVWEPYNTPSLRKFGEYEGLQFNDQSKIFMVNDGDRAIVFAGDITLWDLNRGAILAVFTPDTKITCCNIAMNGQLITFGLHETSDIVIMKLASSNMPSLMDFQGEDMFGEKPEESSDEEDEEDD